MTYRARLCVPLLALATACTAAPPPVGTTAPPAGTPAPAPGRSRPPAGPVRGIVVSRADGATTVIEAADPGTGAVRVLARWRTATLETRAPWLRTFDPTYTRLSDARPGSVGYENPGGTYTPVGAVDPDTQVPVFAYLGARLVVVAAGGTLRDARTRARVHGYPRLRTTAHTTGARPSLPEGIRPKPAWAQLVPSPYGTVSVSLGACAPDASRPGAVVCGPDERNRITWQSAGGEVAHRGGPYAAGSACGTGRDGAVFLCGDHSLSRVRPGGRPVTLAADVGGHPDGFLGGGAVADPGGRRVAVVVRDAHPADPLVVPEHVVVVEAGHARRLPLRLAGRTKVRVLAWR